MTRFTLPISWIAEPYSTHYSFAYEGEAGREDFDFRVEFTEGVPESEQTTVIDLIETAPRLLTALNRLLDAVGSQSPGVYQGDMLDAIAEAVLAAAVAAGRPA